MVGNNESMLIASIASWFTPTILFCVTNILIGTLFIASNISNNHKQNDDHTHSDSTDSFSRITRSSPKTESDSPQPSQLTRTPSLLERVKSIKFTSIPTESEHITNSPSQLTRVPSFFDRVKSFKISSPFTYEPPSTQHDPSQHPDHHVIRSKSENIAVIKKKSSLVSEMKKSRSEMRLDAEDDEDVDIRRPATTRERRNVVDEEVDAKADDFISRFKQQLKLQRLESLVRYNEKLNKRS
ncbi:hypothetical protein CTI12_AA517100 [Artemisia annua]|uniref:DUF4408 domain-containing protein n=1 Tax=Artemisia annua TaxID=35608 RepID=A0A2U1L945_ARTAN|nr:hypothetical protein CTI12_AA517100 [Artemisia annua]